MGFWPLLFVSLILLIGNLCNAETQIYKKESAGLILFPNDIPTTVEGIDLSMNYLTNIPSGSLAGYTQVKILYLENNLFTDIPQEICNVGEHLARLLINNNRITRLNDSVLGCLKVLSFLNLRSNGIMILPDLTPLVKLQSLMLSENPLTSIHNNSMTSLVDLVYLVLERCSLSETDILTLGINSDKLHTLDLTGNKMQRFPLEAFQTSTNIENLDIDHNLFIVMPKLNNISQRIHTVKIDNTFIGDPTDDFFMDLHGLKVISLMFCRLTKWPLGLKDVAQTIETIVISNNNILMLTINGQFPFLKKLDTQNNPLIAISALESAFGGSIIDLYLGVAHNIGIHTFAGSFLKLQKLDLVLYFGDSISFPKFGFMPELTVLRLSGTQIQTIPEDAFQGQPNLAYLYLPNNNITTLYDIRKHLPNIKTINLDGNPITCDCNMVWLRMLSAEKQLDLTSAGDGRICNKPESLRFKDFRTEIKIDELCQGPIQWYKAGVLNQVLNATTTGTTIITSSDDCASLCLAHGFCKGFQTNYQVTECQLYVTEQQDGVTGFNKNGGVIFKKMP